MNVRLVDMTEKFQGHAMVVVGVENQESLGTFCFQIIAR